MSLKQRRAKKKRAEDAKIERVVQALASDEPSFVLRTVTGRISSRLPNLQNVSRGMRDTEKAISFGQRYGLSSAEFIKAFRAGGQFERSLVDMAKVIERIKNDGK